MNKEIEIVTENPTPDSKPPVAHDAPATLPDGYLADGYYATTDKGDKYLRPEYVSRFAQKIAADLSPMKPADFASLLREMKRAKKRSLPFEARQTAASEMLPKVLTLVHRKKAPRLLCDVVQANLGAIHSDEDWYAYYRHLEAVNGFLSIEKGGDI